MANPSYRSGNPIAYQAPPLTTQAFNQAEYFSGVDCSIFFGNEYIDEITGLQFTLQERVLPVYGYASYTAKRILRGTRIVQGQFTTNMRAANYLHELLYRDVLQANSDVVPTGLTIPPNQPLPQPDPVANPADFQRWMDGNVNLYWKSIETAISVNNAIDYSHTPYFAAPAFTLLILYGDIDHTDYTRSQDKIRTIQNVEIFQVAQSIDLSPNAIGETWNFIATDINGIGVNRQINGFS